MINSRITRLKIIKPVRSGQTTEQVVARVYELIKQEDLQPGDRLPQERELAKQLGISRPSLLDGPPALASEPLRLLAQLHGFSFDHMFETRSVLEVGAAGMAAERATGDH